MSAYYRSKRACVRCGNEFNASRSDAKYCSPACRKQASLQRQRIRSFCETTITNVKLLLQYSKQPDFTWDTKAALAEISKLIEFTDTRLAAAAGSRDLDAAISKVNDIRGTDESSSGKSVTAGTDTSSAVQPDVKSLKWDIQELKKRIDDLENAIDWRQVGVR